MNKRKFKLKQQDSDYMLQRRNGITLIALVISIIVMLILAGVSLSATIGENGILTQAKNAKIAQEESREREELEYILYDYNSSSFFGKTNGITSYLSELKNNGKIALIYR